MRAFGFGLTLSLSKGEAAESTHYPAARHLAKTPARKLEERATAGGGAGRARSRAADSAGSEDARGPR
jgi:hypothetical protein